MKLKHFAIIISIFSPGIIQIISNQNYQGAKLILPIIIFGFMMGGLYKIPSVILSYHKIVWFYPLLGLFSFGINTFLNWILIPEHGPRGAAFASFISFYIYSLMMVLLSYKYFTKKWVLTTATLYLICLIFVFLYYYKT